jgi:hypothetical protein
MNRLIRGLKEDGVYLAGEDTSEFPTKAHGAESQLKDGLWGFLRDKGNQQVLGWLGGAGRCGDRTLGGLCLFLPSWEISRGEISRADASQRAGKLWWHCHRP